MRKHTPLQHSREYGTADITLPLVDSKPHLFPLTASKRFGAEGKMAQPLDKRACGRRHLHKCIDHTLQALSRTSMRRDGRRDVEVQGAIAMTLEFENTMSAMIQRRIRRDKPSNSNASRARTVAERQGVWPQKQPPRQQGSSKPHHSPQPAEPVVEVDYRGLIAPTAWRSSFVAKANNIHEEANGKRTCTVQLNKTGAGWPFTGQSNSIPCRTFYRKAHYEHYQRGCGE